MNSMGLCDECINRKTKCYVNYCEKFKKNKNKTNEDYMQSCNTEQLAEVINKIIEQCFLCGVNENNSKKCIFGSCSRVIEWLKQPHNREE